MNPQTYMCRLQRKGTEVLFRSTVCIQYTYMSGKDVSVLQSAYHSCEWMHAVSEVTQALDTYVGIQAACLKWKILYSWSLLCSNELAVLTGHIISWRAPLLCKADSTSIQEEYGCVKSDRRAHYKEERIVDKPLTLSWPLFSVGVYSKVCMWSKDYTCWCCLLLAGEWCIQHTLLLLANCFWKKSLSNTLPDLFEREGPLSSSLSSSMSLYTTTQHSTAPQTCTTSVQTHTL